MSQGERVCGRGRVLVVDDHVEMARILADELVDAGYAVEIAAGGAEAIEHFRKNLFDAVVCDLRMEKVDGFDVLEAVRAIDPGVAVLIMTAFGGIESAVEAIKRGAYHYLTKPFGFQELSVFLERALAERRLREENRALRKLAQEQASIGAMVGSSRPMQELFGLIERVAPSVVPVLIRGESGTGKELVARALHFNSPRRDKPFVAVNCTTLPEQLLESELFGHVKGAYTGASSVRRGLMVEADGGTLFLDEIGDMAPALQAKLLRVLEDGEIRPVGADAPRRVDVRIVAATHQDLEARVSENRFRADLYFRLNVVPLSVPPLRERPEDVPALVEHFLKLSLGRNPHAKVRGLSSEALGALARQGWPGNVRELRNVVERLAIVSIKETIDVQELAAQLPAVAVSAGPLERAKEKMVPLRQLESEYIAHVIARCGGNKTRAAEVLGIDVSTIHRRERSD